MSPVGDRRDGGFVLVEVLVGMAILAFSGVMIYQIGLNLLSRTEGDLDRAVAATNLHTIAFVLEARGPLAETMLPFEDETFRYVFSKPPKEELLPDGTESGFYWAELAATDRKSGQPVLAVVVGYCE
jgi:prepilin-type N-terminal cleavage/methylation domain-containing protein